MIQRVSTFILFGIAAIGLTACAMDKQETQAQDLGTATAALENGDEDFCSTENLCGIGEADCDSSDECQDGLRCLFNVGAEYGFDSRVDVCDCPTEEFLGSATFCSETCPCDLGEGDCDTVGGDDTAECAPGLRCYDDAGAVFGLEETDDVCADCLPPEGNGTIDFCNGDCQCEEAQGDCDSSSDCAPGLTCYLNVGTDFGFDDPGTDVCATCAPDSLSGRFDFCKEGCECSDGEGDCDSNADCQEGLTCFLNVGTDFGYDDPGIDVCAQCAPDSLNGESFTFCSEDCPCDIGQGDCDNDAQCAGDLICGQDNGADFGFEPSTMDFCIDP